MKKSILALSLALAIPGIHSAMANTGTITFNGTLTSNTCNVSVNGGNASDTVVLPTVSEGVLDAAGKTAGQTRFTLGLSGCTGSLKTASAYFEAGTGVNGDGRLINTGSAQNVDLQLRDSTKSGAVIKAGSSEQVNNAGYVTLASGAASLPYTAEYYATGKAVAGNVTSSVTYNIQYK